MIRRPFCSWSWAELAKVESKKICKAKARSSKWEGNRFRGWVCPALKERQTNKKQKNTSKPAWKKCSDCVHRQGLESCNRHLTFGSVSHMRMPAETFPNPTWPTRWKTPRTQRTTGHGAKCKFQKHLNHLNREVSTEYSQKNQNGLGTRQPDRACAILLPRAGRLQETDALAFPLSPMKTSFAPGHDFSIGPGRKPCKDRPGKVAMVQGNYFKSATKKTQDCAKFRENPNRWMKHVWSWQKNCMWNQLLQIRPHRRCWSVVLLCRAKRNHESTNPCQSFRRGSHFRPETMRFEKPVPAWYSVSFSYHYKIGSPAPRQAN